MDRIFTTYNTLLGGRYYLDLAQEYYLDLPNRNCEKFWLNR